MPLGEEVLSKYTNHTLVETGTHQTATVDLGLKLGFKQIHTMDISKPHTHSATLKYAKEARVRVYTGDSAVLLPPLLPKLEDSITFWLDAHPQGPLSLTNCPLLQELAAIKAYAPKMVAHVVLIDDMRLFSEEERTKIKATLCAVRTGTEIMTDMGLCADDILVGKLPACPVKGQTE